MPSVPASSTPRHHFVTNPHDGQTSMLACTRLRGAASSRLYTLQCSYAAARPALGRLQFTYSSCLFSTAHRPPRPPASSRYALAGSPVYARTRSFVSARSEPEPTCFPDPERPDLFYHLFEPPTPVSSSVPVFALSFLEQRPASAQSPAVIGWLPASSSADADSAGLNDFVENPSFREILHEAIRGGLMDGVDEVLINGAIQTQEGWMHIHDNRNIPALGRIGDPDDILGSVRVENSQILAETYQPMPAYRMCTSDGVLQLSEGIAKRLKEMLEARA
ncbi:uncharacterized protein FIBRA_05179 [Fibroporia radiculosa]|uniref:Uncharacterized protein n=1 Tax=Fibroporia radiculosa TaxID=599839 RepID=J4H3D0_9APHY|nr:uncharacterized protein FIBRA_05179 [Fibroporia radiculosa]CCM03059.1 predicted protein [Fibroporia radiculosa]